MIKISFSSCNRIWCETKSRSVTGNPNRLLNYVHVIAPRPTYGLLQDDKTGNSVVVSWWFVLTFDSEKKTRDCFCTMGRGSVARTNSPKFDQSWKLFSMVGKHIIKIHSNYNCMELPLLSSIWSEYNGRLRKCFFWIRYVIYIKFENFKKIALVNC